MTLPFEDVCVEDMTVDASPADVPEHPCANYAVCGNETFRNGSRGRWPKVCETCKEEKAVPVKPRTGGATKGAADKARQAASVLGQYNSLLAIGLMLLPEPYALPATAAAIAAKNDLFEAQAAEALITDPKLCALILKTGAASGKLQLAFAYGMFLTAVAGVAIPEYKSKGIGA
jgi:hypothetical protein